MLHPKQKIPNLVERKGAYLQYGKDITYINDFFSASWLMNVRRFMDINTDKIATVEDACFQPFRQFSNDLRMTRDWLEFSVEHMSKWWKIINIFNHNQVFETYITKLEQFIQKNTVDQGLSQLRNTIALVAFMPYGDKNNKEKGQVLTVSMLKACIRSMSRYGMGRIVVVVATKEIRDTYERLFPSKFNKTEVVFREVTIVKTRFITTNMPFAAIAGLQRAFKSDDNDWLGNEKNWNAVYLTEPDTLLHLKPSVLPDLIDGILNRGWVLSPHRLQPIPHATDLPDPLSSIVVVPNNEYHEVMTVDSSNTCCWDAGNVRPYGDKVTQPQNPKKCDNFWYMCGFHSGDHSSIRSYGLMRLTQGIGITMLMGNEHGRQCYVETIDVKTPIKLPKNQNLEINQPYHLPHQNDRIKKEHNEVSERKYINLKKMTFYVINLKEEEGRRHFIEQQMKDLDLKYHIIPSVRAKPISIGRWLSYLKILKLKNLQFPFAIIEDNCHFFYERFDTGLIIPEDADGLSLGHADFEEYTQSNYGLPKSQNDKSSYKIYDEQYFRVGTMSTDNGMIYLSEKFRQWAIEVYLKLLLTNDQLKPIINAYPQFPKEFLILSPQSPWCYSSNKHFDNQPATITDKMIKIAFHDNQLCERGTTISLYDYAYYNKHYLGNESIIMYDENNFRNTDSVIEKFKKEFKVYSYEDWNKDAIKVLKEEKCDILYMQKAGDWDEKMAPPEVCKTVIHCVFNTSKPHGDVYGRISGSFGDHKCPVVNYMVNLPDVEEDMRKEVGIPSDATVFGRIGGLDQFDIPAVHQAIDRITDDDQSVYFFLVNTDKFCRKKNNIIHYGKIIDLEKKVRFINSCDAMIHARNMGETFGAAVSEFSIKNKPVITCKGTDNAHLDILKDKAILYDKNDVEQIYGIFKNFDKESMSKKDWNGYNEYLPEKIMDAFNKIFIQPLIT